MSDLIGKTLGSYRILEQIGVGGMATVYKAYQPGMDRYVAIKVLPHYLTQDEQFVKRFQREARAIARLEHAHILPVHDYGEAGDTTYIAMRYVEAGTLKQRIAHGPLPLDEIARLVGQIGSALDYAHRLGVIHRDVKPSNVLIDDQGNTYLTDFGLARMMEASDQLTASGVGVGTPAYMSPEQGQGIKVDHRSDIYSLGVVLFEMVTGHVPYEAETPMAVMLKHITDPLPLPRTINPHVPEPVELVILKALAKDPAHRYQTAGEMVQALNAAVRKASVKEVAVEPRLIEAAPPRKDISLVTRLEQTWAQPRGKVGLISSAILLLAFLALLLSQLPGNVAIVGPGANASATSAVAQATATTTQATVTAPTSTPQTIATLTSDARPPSAESQVTSLWTTNGPYGGPVNSFAINPDTPTTLYATVFNRGVFRTRNGGESWELVFASEYNNPLEMDPLSPDRIYMGRSFEGLYRSDDGGDSWTAIPIPGKSAETYLPAAHPTVAGTVYAGLDGPCPAGCGLFKSEDYGQTWIDRTNGLTDTLVTALAFDPADPQVMYVGTSNGNVFRSTNGGEAWEFIGQPDRYISRLAVNPFGAHEVWASNGDGRGHWGFVSKYASGAWVQASEGMGAIVFDQNVAGTVWLGPYKSTDGGLTWTDLNAVPRQLIALAVNPTDPRVVYQGYNGAGVYKTTDGGATWQEVNQGLTGLIPNGLVIAPDNPDSVYATVHGTGIFKTTDGGKTWRRIPTENEWPRFPIVDPVKPGRLYVRGTNGVDITEDDGATWHRALPQLPPKYAACCGFRLHSLIATGQPGYMVAGGGFWGNASGEAVAGAIYTSRDFGETWAYVDVGREISPVITLASDPRNPAVIYAGTGDYKGQGNGIWKSSDGGATWSPSMVSDQQVNGIGVEPAPPYRVFAAYGGAVFVSTDEGASWTAANAPPTGEYGLHWLGFVPGDPPALYASSAKGFFYSTDGANSWQEVAGNLGSQVRSLVASVTEAGMTLYVGATGGVYRLESAPPEATAGACADVASGLIGWWPGEGNAKDRVAGNDGKLVGGVSFAPGMVGQAFRFNGIDGAVNIPRASSFDTLEQFSIEFWMKIDADNPLTECCQGLVSADHYLVEFVEGGSLNFTLNNQQDERLFIGAQYGSTELFRAATDKWWHIASVYDGNTTGLLYVNGRLEAERTGYSGAIPPMLANSFLSIGSEDGSTICPPCLGRRYFGGWIDEVAIYNRALTASEIQAIYSAGGAGKCTPSTSTPPSGQAAQSRAFTNPNDFQTAITGLGVPTVVDFEDIDAGPINNTFVGRDPFDGKKYASHGIVFSNPDGIPLFTAPEGAADRDGRIWNASNSVSIEQFPFDLNAEGPINDQLLVILDPPVVAIGFTIVDLQFGSGLAQFIDSEGNTVRQIDVSTEYASNRAFAGIVSVERPIAMVKFANGPNTGDVTYDDFIFVPTSAPSAPTQTPSPFGQGKMLYICDDDMCIGDKRVGLSDRYAGFSTDGSGPSWSPDGSRFVFSARPKQTSAPPLWCKGDIIIANHDGSQFTPVVTGPDYAEMPAWSPDGEWIAFSYYNRIVVLRPDGKDRQQIVGDRKVCLAGLAWSPDSQRIAWIEDLYCGGSGGEGPNHVWVVNRDGTQMQNIFKTTDPLLSRNLVAWSLDGKSVAVMLQNGETLLIDANCNSRPSGCDGSSRTRLDTWPHHWTDDFYPQWDGEVLAATITPQAEQARAFAGPILQAIADRPPDFADDFSTADKGWGIGGEMQEGSGIQDGVVRLRVKEGSATTGNTALGRKDFVLQVDARVAAGDKATQLIVNFHNLSGEYWFYVVVNSAGNTWLVDKHVPRDQRNLANGSGSVSPFEEPTRIMIVARGPRAAIYLNDAPVAYFEDADFDTSGGTGLFCQSLGQAVCEFDNVKFWNLDNVPGLP